MPEWFHLAIAGHCEGRGRCPHGRTRHGPLTLDPLEQRSLPMALLQLLLEQFVAGPGAGQEQPEALEAETLGSEVSLAQGLPRRRALWRVQGVRVPCPLLGEGRQSAELCLGAHEGACGLRLHLVRRDEAQELVHVAHVQPVGVEFHGGLHLLGSEEVLQGLVHLLALGAAHTG